MRSQSPRTKSSVVSGFRRSQILEAARRTFIQCGVADTSVDQIARSARIAKGTVYLYYKSKDEILRQLLTADLAELHADTVPAIVAPGTLADRLERYFRASLAFFERKRDFIDQCHLDMSVDVRKKARQKLGLVFAAQTEAWTKVLAEQWRSAGLGAGPGLPDPSGTAGIIVSLAHGLAIQRLRGWHTSTLEDAAALATALVSNGVVKS